MYMTVVLGWPCENTIFPFGYVVTRCGAPADLRNASTSKSGCISLLLDGRAFVFDMEKPVANYRMGVRRLDGRCLRRRGHNMFRRLTTWTRLRREAVGLISSRRIMRREEAAKLEVLREVARDHPRSCHGCGDLPFTHLHIPEREHRFDLNEEVVTTRVNHLADGKQSAL